jgi:hypothetical protein
VSRRIKSLQLRLTAGSLADRELGLRAKDLARYVSLDESRKSRLDLPRR